MIDDFRVIQAQVLTEKAGAFVDLKDYCSNFSIEYGDVSGSGTQSSDGVPALLSLTIKNDNNNNFNPLDRTSAWNDVGGVYTPLLWNNRNMKIRANAFSTTKKTAIIHGNGSNVYNAPEKNIVPFTVSVKNILGTAPTLASLGSYTFTDNYFGKQLGAYTFNELYALTPFDYSNVIFINQFVFGAPLSSGQIVEVQYLVTNESELRTLFDGVMGDDVSPSHSQVSLQMRDKTKVLQDAIINISSCRQYVAGGTPVAPTYTDPITSIVYNDGIPLETYIQNLLDDVLGSGIMTLNTIESPLYAVTPTNDILQYQTLWNAIQGVVSSIGWYIGFRYKNEAEGMVLTLLEPPRTKNTADYALTYTDDFYICTGKFDFSSVRNKITVQYQDINGTNQSVTVQDATSISNNGLKELIITKEYTKGIVLLADATNMANKILSDLKNPRLCTQIEMPFFPDIQPFHTISLTYPKFSSTVDFYAVDSVRHDFDFQANRFRTILNCNTSVTGGQGRWLKMAARPGVYQPSTANKLTEAYSYQPPTNITLSGAAIVFSGTAVNVTVDITFDKPLLDNPASYEIQYKKNTDATWDNALKVVTKDLKTKLILSSNVQHNFRVASIAKNGDRGAWSGTVDYTPTGSTLTVTDADLAGERDDTLYIKSQAQMDAWVANVCVTPAFTPDYSRVIITDGTYTIGSTSDRKLSININKNIFSIEGRGDVKITFYKKLYGKFLTTNADNFTFSGITLDINLEDYGGTAFYLALIGVNANSATTVNNYFIENNKITLSNVVGGGNAFQNLITVNNNFSNGSIYILSNEIYVDINIDGGSGAKVKLCNIKNNIVKAPATIIVENTDVCNITQNRIEKTGTTYCIATSNVNQVNVMENAFYYSSSMKGNCIEIFNTTRAGVFTNNNALFDISSDNEEQGVYFVYNNNPAISQIVSNNVCIDNDVSWQRLYGTNTVNVTSGTNTLTLAGATFQTDLKIGQKVKVGTQERTILTIPTQTQLTVNTNWTSTVTGAVPLFEKASIKTWLGEPTNSRNNIVVNNTNNSY